MYRIVLSCLVVVMLCSCVARSPRVLKQTRYCPPWSELKLPLTVAITEDAVHHRSEVNQAMRNWNDAMGRAAFVWVYVDGVPADIVITSEPVTCSDDVFDCHRVESIARTCAAGRMSQAIALSPYFDELAAYHYTQHALGHALGVGHSDVLVSAMRAQLDVDLMADRDELMPEPQFYMITDGDAELANRLHP